MKPSIGEPAGEVTAVGLVVSAEGGGDVVVVVWVEGGVTEGEHRACVRGGQPSAGQSGRNREEEDRDHGENGRAIIVLHC